MKTGAQTNRSTDQLTDCMTEGMAECREKKSQIYKKEKIRQPGKKLNLKIEMLAVQKKRKAGGPKDRQPDKQNDRQTNRQADIQTHRQTHR